MKKMRLEVDALAVETFEAGVSAGLGTVRANSAMDGCTGGRGNCYDSVVNSCGGSPALCGAEGGTNDTCGGNTCGSTCENTCRNTCVGAPANCAPWTGMLLTCGATCGIPTYYDPEQCPISSPAIGC